MAPPDYNPDEILGRMRADHESDWPWRLLRSISRRPLVDESELRTGSAWVRPGDLSPSELRVLEAISRGLTIEMAADVLGVGHETVKSQIKSARYRLKAKNITHACCEAIRLGLIK